MSGLGEYTDEELRNELIMRSEEIEGLDDIIDPNSLDYKRVAALIESVYQRGLTNGRVEEAEACGV